MKMTMKVLSAMLTVVMIFGIITSAPVTAFAKEAEEQPVAASEESTASQFEDSSGLIEETEDSTDTILTESVTASKEAASEQTTEPSDKDDEAVGATSGTTGSCTWSVTDGVLTISGQGKMADYIRGNNGGPWSKTITSVIVEPGVTYIGNYAFYKCTKLQSADVAGSVTAIGEAAFSECSSLLKFTIPDGIKTISNSTFKGCSSLVELNIPNSVTSINSFAMNGCTSLTEIFIPDGIKTINANTFSGCSSLTSISIPKSVTTIGNYAFSNCSAITEFSIPDSVTTIGDYAFSSCPGITDFSFPDSVTSIGQYVLSSCDKLKSVKLPKNITSISKGFLSKCKSITEITIPDWITSINDEAFAQCTSLNNVSIPDTVTKIGGSVFYKCTKLTEIDIPGSVTTLGSGVFDSCTSLETAVIPDGVKTIPSNAFSGCTSLTSVTLHDGVTTFGSSAFLNCAALNSISVPDGLTSIGESCFAGCESLKSFVIPDGVSIINKSVFSRTGLTEIDIPGSVTKINQYAFKECKSLKSIQLNPGIETIGNEAFSYCSALKEITLPDGVITISDKAFTYCKNLTEISVPNSVTSLGYNIFESCTSLRRFTIPNQIKRIPNFLLYNCSSIQMVTIPKSVTAIGTAAFRGCSSLESISIPDSVTSIETNAFWNCVNLKSIVIPDSVKSLSGSVFLECTALEEVKFSNKLKKVPSSSFSGCVSLKEFVVPSSVNTIEGKAFYNCKSLKTITIPDSVSSIGQNVFYNIKNLTIRCVPESYAEQYAIKNKYNYVHMHVAYGGKLTVKANEAFENYIVSVTDKTNKTITGQITNGSCVFSFINPEMEYSISLINKYGRTIAKKTLDLLENGNGEVYFKIENLFDSAVIVKTEDGSVVSDYSVEWFVNGAAAAESTAASVRFLNKGDNVTCRVRLGDSLKKIYENPSDLTKEITLKNETFLFEAKRAATKDITVKVINEKGEVVPSANVSIVQQIDSRMNSADNYTTDENGILNVSLRKIQTSIKATDASFYSVNWNGIPEESEITLMLKSVVGASFIPNITYRYSENTIRADMTETNLDSLNFFVFNATKGVPVNNYNYNNNRLIIPFEEITKGDKLEISVTDSGRVFANAQASVTYNNNAEYFDLTLVETGKIAIEYTSENEDNMALIFNAGGACEDVVELSEGNLSSGLNAGTYTVVLMGYSQLLLNTPNLAYLEQYGLIEGDHYIKCDVTVSDCETSTLNKKKIPKLDEKEITIIDSYQSYVLLSSDKLKIGRNIRVTANYDISEKHKYLYDVKGVEFVFPEGASVGSKINIDGSDSDDFTFDGTKLTVPVTGQQGKILASVRWNKNFDSENVNVYAYLLLEKDNKRITQPIGMASMTGNMSFNVPSLTATAAIPVYGSVSSNSTVDVFVDGVHQISVQASKSGHFNATVELNNTAKHSFHQVYFEVSGTESSYRSKSFSVEYDVQAVCLDAIYLSPNGHMSKSVKLYSADGNFSDTYYIFQLYSTLTFKVDFTGDVSRLTNVVLITSTKSGKDNYIQLKRIGTTNSFTGSHTFKGDFPDSIDVIYNCEKEYLLDWEEVKQNQEKYQQSIDGVNDLIGELKDCFNDLNDEEKAEFATEAMKDIEDVDGAYDVYRKADGTIVIQDDEGLFGLRTREWDDKTKTESDLINEGYTKVKTTNPNDAIYVLNNQNENITADLITHHFTAVYFDDNPKADEAVGWGPEDTGIEAANLLSSLISQLEQKYRAVQKLAETQEANSVAWRRIFGEKSKLVAQFEAQQGEGFAELAKKAAQEAKHAEKLADTFEVFGKLLNKLLLVVNLIQLHQDAKFYTSMVDELNKMKEDYKYYKFLDAVTHCADAELLDFMNAINDLRKELIKLRTALSFAICNTILQFATLLAGPASLVTEVILATIGLVVDVFQSISKTAVENAYANACICRDAVELALTKCGHNPKKRRGIKKKIDPSGYVYEAVPSNKLSDVTVTAFFSENPDGSDAEVWDSEEYDQKNPLYTDSEGHYEWFVPEGYWQVRCEKDGYLTAYSDWLPVPPPQTDVNIPMVSLEAPELLYTNAYSDSVEFEFSQYMDPDTFNHQTVKVFSDGEAVNGDIIPLNAEKSLDGKYYTKRFAFVPADNSQLSGNIEADIQSVQNYAGLSINDPYKNLLEIKERVTEIILEDNLTFNYGESAEAVVQFNPAEAAAGRTVTVKVDNTSVLEAKTDKVTVDKNGKAVVGFNQLLPGKATITYILNGTDLKSETTVVCVPEQEQLPRVTASIESGAKVTKGTKLELFCENTDAKIYYTLDLSCPCQENNPDRILYTGPITLNEDTQLIAYAILDGYEDSKTRLFTYTVSNRAIGDVTGDNTVDILDAVRVQKYTVEKVAFTDEQKECADVNDDGVIDILDTTMIQKFAVDRITSFKKKG